LQNLPFLIVPVHAGFLPNELRMDVAKMANAKAQFNTPATGGKNHRLIRVEQAVGRIWIYCTTNKPSCTNQKFGGFRNRRGGTPDLGV
jgi:hypothetical protein